jgi:hypothetical protein
VVLGIPGHREGLHSASDSPNTAKKTQIWTVSSWFHGLSIQGQPASEDPVAIQSLHDIQREDLAQLKVATEGRKLARIDCEDAPYLHPTPPKVVTLNYR